MQSLAELQQMVREHEAALNKVGDPLSRLQMLIMTYLLTRSKSYVSQPLARHLGRPLRRHPWRSW